MRTLYSGKDLGFVQNIAEFGLCSKQAPHFVFRKRSGFCRKYSGIRPLFKRSSPSASSPARRFFVARHITKLTSYRMPVTFSLSLPLPPPPFYASHWNNVTILKIFAVPDFQSSHPQRKDCFIWTWHQKFHIKATLGWSIYISFHWSRDPSTFPRGRLASTCVLQTPWNNKNVKSLDHGNPGIQREIGWNQILQKHVWAGKIGFSLKTKDRTYMVTMPNCGKIGCGLQNFQTWWNLHNFFFSTFLFGN